MQTNLSIVGISSNNSPLDGCLLTMDAKQFPIEPFRFSELAKVAEFVLIVYPDETFEINPNYVAKSSTISVESSGSWQYQPRVFPSTLLVCIDSKGRIYPAESHSFELSKEISIERKRAFGVLREGSYVQHPIPILESVSLMVDHNNAPAAGAMIQRLKRTPLTRPDSIAIINLEAHILLIKQQWEDCLTLCSNSIEAEPNQCSAYLLAYKANAALHRWEPAYKNLFLMLEQEEGSALNWDVAIPDVDAHILLGELAFKMGWHDRCYLHYDFAHSLDASRLGSDLLQRQFIFAIELQDREKSMHYFQVLYGSDLDATLSEALWNRLDESMVLFLNNDWHTEVLGIIEKLYQNNKNHKSLLRRWVSVLMKSGKVAQAQQLLNQNTSIIS